jgi:transglutaminase-like putative cysteine protease
MEKEAVAGEPTVFEEEFIYTIYGEYRPISAADVLPYDTTTELYRTYTAERDEHVIFTPQMRALSDSLTRGLTNPYDKVKAIFTWIASTFPWCGAREYSTIANIPEYVLQVKHADCGQKTLLLLTLCRIAGIPCHFQSGLITPPSGWNLHDWAEVYYEGIGWVPIDVSNGFMSLIKGTEHEYFYLTGVDSYRLIVNQDFGMPLSPAKEYPRSETVDFQRGEVEWRGGNLYFDTWSYDMEIEYL